MLQASDRIREKGPSFASCDSLLDHQRLAEGGIRPMSESLGRRSLININSTSHQLSWCQCHLKGLLAAADGQLIRNRAFELFDQLCEGQLSGGAPVDCQDKVVLL